MNNFKKYWKEIQKLADKDRLSIKDFMPLLSIFEYKEVAYEPLTNKRGEIYARVLLVITAEKSMLKIKLGKNYNILSITPL